MGFFGSFFGNDQRNDIANANKKANAALDSGYNSQQGYYDKAAGAYQPWVDTGKQANTFYGNALGLNGDAARASAEDTITSDPLWSGKFALDSNNVLKNLNARGLGASGAGALAGQRVLTEDYGNWLDRYNDLSKTGLGAASGQAGVWQGEGNNSWNYGTTKAGNDINYGNALAESRNIGLNNILGVIGTGISGYNALANKGVGSSYKIGA